MLDYVSHRTFPLPLDEKRGLHVRLARISTFFLWNRVGSCNVWICLTAWTERCQVLDQQAASQQLFSSELEAEAAVMWERLLPSLWT